MPQSSAIGRILVIIAFEFVLAVPSQADQYGPGFPLTGDHAGWIEWSNKPQPISWLNAVQQWAAVDPKWNSMFSATTLRWEGDTQSRGCADPSTIARIGKLAGSDQATISICLRSIDLYRELIRSLDLYQISTLPELGYPRLSRLIDRYASYLQSIVQRDIFATNARTDYKRFCTVEYFIYIGLIDVEEPEKCDQPAVLERNGQSFLSAVYTGFFFPPKVLAQAMTSGTPHRSSPQVVQDYLTMQSNEEWRGMWMFPILHEMGHLASCHHGPIGAAVCKAAASLSLTALGMHTPGTSTEIEADQWALSILSKARREDPWELVGDIRRWYGFQMLGAMSQTLSEEKFSGIAARLNSSTPYMKSSLDMIMLDKEMPETIKKMLKDIVKNAPP